MKPRVTPISTYDPVDCECVRALRQKLGVNIRGNAVDIAPNTVVGDITIGTVILFQYENVSHAGLIIGLNRDIATVHEFNYHPCEEGFREVSIYDSTVKGFYRP